jgi:transcription elongation factor GreA
LDAIPITRRGYEKLQEELTFLKTVERPKVVEAIAAARVLGDLSENAEYHSAKDRQGLIEARIIDIEGKISKASIIDVSKIVSNTIKFGATIELIDESTGVISKFQIVGSCEADIQNGLLPITSPLARALIGKAVGDVVEVRSPGGVRTYEISALKYV